MHRNLNTMKRHFSIRIKLRRAWWMRQKFSISIWFKIYFVLFSYDCVLFVCWFSANIGEIEFEYHKYKTNFKKICIIADRNKPLNPHREVVCAGNSRGLIQLGKKICTILTNREHLSFEHLCVYVLTQEEPMSVNFPV